MAAATLSTWDGEVVEVLEYAKHVVALNDSQCLALCVIAIPGGTFTEWRFVDDLRIEAA